jgi:hypothetical protein
MPLTALRERRRMETPSGLERKGSLLLLRVAIRTAEVLPRAGTAHHIESYPNNCDDNTAHRRTSMERLLKLSHMIENSRSPGNAGGIKSVLEDIRKS